MQFQSPGPQPLRWSTDQVDRRQSLAYWVDAVCDNFLDLEVDTPLKEHFRAHLERLPLGPATVNVFEAERQRVSRTRALIARGGSPVFVLLRMLQGEIAFRQGGREARVRAGESLLINGSEPYQLDCPGATRAVGLRMPSAWLQAWVPHAERHPATVFVGDRWSGALNASLGCIEAATREELALPGGAVADQLAAQLALALGPEAPLPKSASLYGRLVRTLQDRLHETDLSPAAVAAQHQLSQRALYYAFSAAGTTFMDALLELRLDRAQALLDDRRLADRPVADIATICGFTDPSHFARRFRRRHGLAPNAYRAARERASP